VPAPRPRFRAGGRGADEAAPGAGGGDPRARLACRRSRAQPALKGIAQQLASQLAQEQGKTRFFKAHEELRRLQVKLSRL